MTRIVAVVPARMGSSRFPGKPLTPILGHPMIEHVYRRTLGARCLADAYVATCDESIRRAVEGFGGKVVMTSASHERATDRVAEAAQQIDADIVVMVQGDEPLVVPAMIDRAVEPMLTDASVGCVNLVRRIADAEEHRNPNVIKVAKARDGRALFFSREPIPTPRVLGDGRVPVYSQVCIIPMRRDLLEVYPKLEPGDLERAESVDMLRFLEHGYPVHLVETSYDTYAVDVPGDVAKVEERMRRDPGSLAYLKVKA